MSDVRSIDLALRDLVGSIGTVYPVRLTALSDRPGRVTVVVMPVRASYETQACDGPSSVQAEAELHIVAATADAQGVADMYGHVDAVAALARGAGWSPSEWRGGAVRDTPVAIITATAELIG